MLLLGELVRCAGEEILQEHAVVMDCISIRDVLKLLYLLVVVIDVSGFIVTDSPPPFCMQIHVGEQHFSVDPTIPLQVRCNASLEEWRMCFNLLLVSFDTVKYYEKCHV